MNQNQEVMGREISSTANDADVENKSENYSSASLQSSADYITGEQAAVSYKTDVSSSAQGVATDYPQATGNRYGIYVKSLDQPVSSTRTPHKSSLQNNLYIAEKDLQWEKTLGQGAFGTVWRCQWQGETVAVKRIKIKSAQSSAKAYEGFEWEANRLSLLNHPHIVSFKGLCKGKDYFGMVMEYCEGGSLWDAIQKKYSTLTTPDDGYWFCCWWWALNIAYALKYLHGQGILHRDLKSENVLLDSLGRTKLSDMGLAQADELLAKNDVDVVRRYFGDTRYASPEECAGQHSTAASDIYSFGMLLWQMATCKLPYQDIKKIQSVRKNIREKKYEEIPTYCPQAFQALIKKCWAAPDERPTAELMVQQLESLSAEFQPQYGTLIRAMERLSIFIHPYRDALQYYVVPYTSKKDSSDHSEFWEQREEYTLSLSSDDNTPSENEDKSTSQLKNIKHNISSTNMGNLKNLIQRINDFLLAESPNKKNFDKTPEKLSTDSLLIRGDGGIGKTLTTRYVVTRLIMTMREYLQQPIPNVLPWIPILVRPGLSEWSHAELQNGFTKALKSSIYGFDDQTIKNLKNHPVLVIIDAYDELTLNQSPQNLYQQLELDQWPDVKLLVTCRRETFKVSSQEMRIFGVNGNYQKWYALSFHLNQLFDYLRRRLQWDDNTYSYYIKKFMQAPGLRRVLRNPYVASLLVQSWETISHQNFSTLTRYQIYWSFLQHWLKQAEKQLSPEVIKELSSTERLDSLPDDYAAFAGEVAYQLFIRGLVETEVTRINLSEAAQSWVNLSDSVRKAAIRYYQAQRDRSSKHRQILTQDDYVNMKITRQRYFTSAAPLQKRGTQFSFIHKSFFEFFVAFALLNGLQQGIDGSLVNQPEHFSALLTILFGGRDLTKEESIVDFILDQLQPFVSGHAYRIQYLIDIVQLSREVDRNSEKNDKFRIQAAVNCLRILIEGQISLFNQDFSYIRVPKSNLDGIIAPHANFTGADLTGTSLIGAILPGSVFVKTDLTGTIFNFTLPLKDIKSSVFFGWIRSIVIRPTNAKQIIYLKGNSEIVFHNIDQQSIQSLTLPADCGEHANLALLPDDQRLLLASGSQIIVINYVKNKIEKSIDELALCVACSNKNFLAATGNKYYKVKLWDTHTLEQKAVFKGHTDMVISIAWSPAGDKVVSGSKDRTVRVWDVTKLESLYVLKGHTHYISSLAWSMDGLRLASAGSCDHTCRIWDMNSGEVLSALRLSVDSSINCVAWSPDGSKLAVATGNPACAIQVWNKNGDELVAIFNNKHTNSIQTVNWLDNLNIVSGCYSGDIRFSLLKGINKSTNSIQTVNWLDSLNIISGCYSGNLGFSLLKGINNKATNKVRQGNSNYRQTNFSETTLFKSNQGHSKKIHDVAWSAKAEVVLTGGRDGQLLAWDSEGRLDHHCVKQIDTFLNKFIYNIAWSPNGQQFLVASGESGNIELWLRNDKNKQFAPHVSFAGHKKAVTCLAWSPDENQMISGSNDGMCRIWDVKTGKTEWMITTHQHAITAVCWSPLGDRLLTAGQDFVLRLWNAKQKKLLKEIDGLNINTIAWSGDGKYFITAGDNTSIFLWNAVTGKLQTRLEGHQDYILHVTWSPDNRHFVSLGRKGELRIWSTKTSECVSMYKIAEVELTAAAWEESELLIVSDGEGRLWRFNLFFNKNSCEIKCQWVKGGSQQKSAVCYGMLINGAQGLSDSAVEQFKKHNALTDEKGFYNLFPSQEISYSNKLADQGLFRKRAYMTSNIDSDSGYESESDSESDSSNYSGP
jgi:WD40 repeat protein/serine/threonine protein kinase